MDGGLSSKRYNKAARRFLFVFKKEIKVSLHFFRHSVVKPHNPCTTQLVSSIVFESSSYIGNSEQNSKKMI